MSIDEKISKLLSIHYSSHYFIRRLSRRAHRLLQRLLRGVKTGNVFPFHVRLIRNLAFAFSPIRSRILAFVTLRGLNFSKMT